MKHTQVVLLAMALIGLAGAGAAAQGDRGADAGRSADDGRGPGHDRATPGSGGLSVPERAVGRSIATESGKIGSTEAREPLLAPSANPVR
jgi:hypothetical protein